MQGQTKSKEATTRDLLRAYLSHPQQLPLRRAVLQVHLWAGLLVGLYLIAIGLSGSILVFKDELMPRPSFYGQRPTVDACTPAGLLGSMQVAASAYPMLEPAVASCPTAANPFFAITLRARAPGESSERQLTVYVHPITKKISGALDQDASWIGWVDRFHLDLLLNRNGRQWNGVGAAVLLLLVLSGLLLWWPGTRHWRRGFKVSLRANWKRMNWDLHHALGVWTVMFTLVWGLTGIYFAWPKPFEIAIESISSITTAQYPAQELGRLANRETSIVGHQLDLGDVLLVAMKRCPGAHLAGLFFGTGPKPVLTIYMARKAVGDYANTDFLYFDQRSGDPLFIWHRGQNHTVGDWLMWLSAPLHFGTSWGLIGKVTWASCGLVLPVLTVTGFVMYWNRSLRRWLRSLQRAERHATGPLGEHL